MKRTGQVEPASVQCRRFTIFHRHTCPNHTKLLGTTSLHPPTHTFRLRHTSPLAQDSDPHQADPDHPRSLCQRTFPASLTPQHPQQGGCGGSGGVPGGPIGAGLKTLVSPDTHAAQSNGITPRPSESLTSSRKLPQTCSIVLMVPQGWKLFVG